MRHHAHLGLFVMEFVADEYSAKMSPGRSHEQQPSGARKCSAHVQCKVNGSKLQPSAVKAVLMAIVATIQLTIGAPDLRSGVPGCHFLERVCYWPIAQERESPNWRLPNEPPRCRLLPIFLPSTRVAVKSGPCTQSIRIIYIERDSARIAGGTRIGESYPSVPVGWPCSKAFDFGTFKLFVSDEI